MDSGKFRLRAGAAILIAIGISIALLGGWGEWKLWWYSDSEPQQITALQLAEAGPGNKLHVNVVEYATSPEGWGSSDVGYFLVYPKTYNKEAWSILLRTEGGNSMFGPIVPEDGLQGVVYDGSHSFGSDLRQGLKKLGPINFDKVWVIDHGRTPPPWWSFLLKVLGGLALAAVGAGLFWVIGSDDD